MRPPSPAALWAQGLLAAMALGALLALADDEAVLALAALVAGWAGGRP